MANAWRDLAAGGGDSRRIVAQPAHDIAGRREAQALHLGIRGLVVELVEPARLGFAVVELDRAGIDEGPLAARQFAALVPGALAHRQPRPRLVRRDRFVGQLEDVEVAHARAGDEFLAHHLDDGPAVVGRDRCGRGPAPCWRAAHRGPSPTTRWCSPGAWESRCRHRPGSWDRSRPAGRRRCCRTASCGRDCSLRRGCGRCPWRGPWAAG